VGAFPGNCCNHLYVTIRSEVQRVDHVYRGIAVALPSRPEGTLALRWFLGYKRAVYLPFYALRDSLTCVILFAFRIAEKSRRSGRPPFFLVLLSSSGGPYGCTGRNGAEVFWLR
jgi:hypothetical protein